MRMWWAFEGVIALKQIVNGVALRMVLSLGTVERSGGGSCMPRRFYASGAKT